MGTKGILKLTNFWTSLDLIHADGSVEKFSLPEGSKHPFNFVNSANFAHEVRNVTCHVPQAKSQLMKAEHVRQCLMRGATESDLLSLDETLTIARIMEQTRKQIGVVYPQDD